MGMSDGSSDVCSSDLVHHGVEVVGAVAARRVLVLDVVGGGEVHEVGPHGLHQLHARREDEFRQVGGIDARQRLAGQRQQSVDRSEEHTSELQSLMRISYAVFCLKKKKTKTNKN